VPGALWLAFTHPLVALVVVGIGTLSMLAITVLLVRFLRGIWRRLRGRSDRDGFQQPV
jgi:hypothetical protein